MIDQTILALDQGTTSSRAILFDLDGNILHQHAIGLRASHPHVGWVEQDATRIWHDSLNCVTSVIEAARRAHTPLPSCMGITNQRETVIVWERDTLTPVAPAIVWQDSRTADYCRDLRARGKEEMIQQQTGLLADPYFSASKLAWLLNSTHDLRARAEAGELVFGTPDAYLLAHALPDAEPMIEATNASRTGLVTLETGEWNPELLALYGIPRAMLPRIVPSMYPVGTWQVAGHAMPIAAVLGDQQAASIGQGCATPGKAKITYGTGAFALTSTGSQRQHSDSRLLATLGWQGEDGNRHYALEGSIFTAGSIIKWLRDQLGMVETAQQTAELAASANPECQAMMVPAFVGLGAPYWQAEAKASVFGIDLNTGRAELVRAGLRAISHQTADLVECFAKDGAEMSVLRVDGGMASNDWFLQDIANIANICVERPQITEATAWGAAAAAAVQQGIFADMAEIAARWKCDRRFVPDGAMLSDAQRQHARGRWQQAIEATIEWSQIP